MTSLLTPEFLSHHIGGAFYLNESEQETVHCIKTIELVHDCLLVSFKSSFQLERGTFKDAPLRESYTSTPLHSCTEVDIRPDPDFRIRIISPQERIFIRPREKEDFSLRELRGY
jgi:hypothetical protein